MNLQWISKVELIRVCEYRFIFIRSQRRNLSRIWLVDSRLNACSFPAKWRANVFCGTNACISPAMKNPSKMYGDISLSMNNNEFNNPIFVEYVTSYKDNAFYIIPLKCTERWCRKCDVARNCCRVDEMNWLNQVLFSARGVPQIHFGRADGVERTLWGIPCQSETFLASPWQGVIDIRVLWHIGCKVNLVSVFADC